MRLIREGKAMLYYTESVFYNRLAKLSRSLSVLFVSSVLDKYNDYEVAIADSLAATGVRGLRYYLESNVKPIVYFNDRSWNAYRIIKKNISLNRCYNASVYKLDANLFMRLFKGRFTIIDIDPFGSPSPFIDTAISTVRDSGYILITATDLTALCGLYPKSAFRKYSSMIFKTSFCHEIALRVLIKSIIEAGGRHKRIVKPLLSHYDTQYARVYVYVKDGRTEYPYNNIGYIIICRDGHIDVFNMWELNRMFQRIRTNVDIKCVIGPLWIGPLHDKNFVNMLIKHHSKYPIVDEEDRVRISKLLGVFYDEADSDLPPFFYNIHELSKALSISPPSINDVLHELRKHGYKAVRSHISNVGVKTNASYSDLLDILLDLSKR